MTQVKSQDISMKSKKQHIRLWYECFQICKSDPSLSNNLKDSSDFYEEWGDVSVKFDEWWKSHKSLFEDLEVREVKKVSKNPNVVNLSIPLNENITSILKEVKYIVNKKQTEKLKDLGIDSTDLKSKVIKQGKYSFTQKEIKGVFQYVNLEIYKIYLSMNKPPLNRIFLMEVRKRFDERTRSKLSRTILNIPTLKQFETIYTTNSSVDDLIRSVRRGNSSIKKTITNVSNGKFP